MWTCKLCKIFVDDLRGIHERIGSQSILLTSQKTHGVLCEEPLWFQLAFIQNHNKEE